MHQSFDEITNRRDSRGRSRCRWTTRSRVACRYAFLFGTTLTEAADAMGVKVASVSEAWRSLYPGVSAFRRRRAA